MKRIITLLFCVGIFMLIFTACAAEQPYQQYKEAYRQLKGEKSVVIEHSWALKNSQKIIDSVEEENYFIQETWQVVQDGNGDMAIANLVFKDMDNAPITVNYYYRNGYLYTQNTANPEENYRQKKKEDFARSLVLEGIIDFPQRVIARQSIQDTDQGRLITFELDSEKYYNYHFHVTSKEYSYGEFSTYREPPVYTVLLDQQGRIKQVTGHFCTVNADESAFTMEQSYTITFTQYGDVVLDFPELNDEDFLLLEAPPKK